MAECQSPNHPSDIQHNLDGSPYPTHLDRSAVSTCLTAKPEKHPPNGVTRMSPEVNGIIGCNPDNKLQGKVDQEFDEIEEMRCRENANDCSDTDCNCNKSSDLDVCETSERIKSLDICDDIPEEKDIYNGIEYVVYVSEVQMPDIMRLITKDLSEPYSIYTYRYFIHNWPKLCFLVSIN